MILSDEAALVILALVVLAGVVIVAIIVFGGVLFARGKRVLGLGLIVLVVGALVGPGVSDRLRNLPLHADIDARISFPEALDLRGQRVLFIETGNTICGETCGDILQIGTEVEAHWVGIGTYSPDTPTDEFLGDFGVAPADVLRVVLGQPVADLGDQRYAEPQGQGATADFDVVILHDDQGLLAYYMPHLLGDPLPPRVEVQHAIVVFTDWADPFSTPPPAPTWRLLSARLPQRPFLPLPFANRSVTYPDFAAAPEALFHAVCPFVGPPEMRDDFTYRYRCTPEGI